MSRRIPGVFVPSDVNTANDPAIMAAGPMAELIFRRANEYAKKNGRDGLIFTFDLPIIANGIPNAARHACRLVDVDLWEKRSDGWFISSYLKWNASLAEQAEQKQLNRIGAFVANHKKGQHAEPVPECPECSAPPGAIAGAPPGAVAPQTRDQRQETRDNRPETTDQRGGNG